MLVFVFLVVMQIANQDALVAVNLHQCVLLRINNTVKSEDFLSKIYQVLIFSIFTIVEPHIKGQIYYLNRVAFHDDFFQT